MFDVPKIAETRSPTVLRQLRDELRRMAERGVAEGGTASAAARLHDIQARAAEQGLSVLAPMTTSDCRGGERILRLNFIGLQYESLFSATTEVLG